MTTRTLPEALRPYFWDTDFDKLDMLAYRRFIAERLLEKTTPETFRFLLESFGRPELLKIAEESRRLHARDREFWRLYLAEA